MVNKVLIKIKFKNYLFNFDTQFFVKSISFVCKISKQSKYLGYLHAKNIKFYYISLSSYEKGN